MKGNMFLGYARGSVGDVTFARQKGQQVGRARNRKPANPRTQSQMTQRSIFMAAVKFFSRGVQSLFQFAFEDKSPNESDYNAFMRNNASNGIYMTKDNFDNTRYPSVGKWVMSRGSLNGVVQSVYNDEVFRHILNAPLSGDTITTIGQLSTILMAGGAWQINDIATIVYISTDATATSAMQPISAGDEEAKWTIIQFEVNPENTTTLNSIGLSYGTTGGRPYVIVQASTDKISGSCMIQSRKTSNGLKVSSAVLANSPQAEQAVAYGQAMTWKNLVLADWKAREEAMLEGAAVPSTDSATN